MTTEVAIRQPNLSVVDNRATDLSIGVGQTYWTDKQIAVLKQLGIKDATGPDLALFFHQSVRTGLDPFAKQIYMLSRWTKDGPKQTIQTGIDGYRLIARRAADRTQQVISYDETLYCGPDGQWTEVWLSEQHPVAAKVVVYRGKGRYPSVALWKEFVQANKDGSPNSMWSKMPANQLAKCAEAAALRRAFPQDLSGVYIDAEMPEPDDEIDGPPTPPAPTRMSRRRAEPPPPVEPDLEPPAPEPAGPDRPMTPEQHRQMFALFSKQQMKDHDDYIAFVQVVLDDESVESTKSLTVAQASAVIDALVAREQR